MCLFVLLGGVRRHVPPEARILVHQIWPGSQCADPTAAGYAAQQIAILLRNTSEIARYTVDMGGEIELFDLAMRIPPWEELRVLTNIEVQRIRLNTTDAPFASPDADAGIFAAAGCAAADRRAVRVLPALDLGRHRRRAQRGAAASADARRRRDRYSLGHFRLRRQDDE